MIWITKKDRNKITKILMDEKNMTEVEARIYFYLLDIKDQKAYKARVKNNG